MDNKFLGVLLVVVLITSLFSLGLVYLSARSLFGVISGHATSTGEANLSVETSATINFTTNTISWGSGRVNAGSSSAGLNTFAINNVTNGNWTLQQGGGLRIQNLGNLNVSLNLSGTKTAAQLIGGTGPSYLWNISNVETDSCRNATGGVSFLNLNVFYAVNTSTAEYCRFFQFNDSQDTIRIDFNLTIPSDSLTGVLTDTITATAFPAPY
ncbi:hypothetical protein J4416_01555 [Candidatus Pacearchaeota archaeon]|nr:hypothetical protein [uncultured archaeon]AQS34486.1 hypothetical protein [uncultured archaeon]MBS3081608.1 hypothetical protein [Candidatus Pacearchaeota archaeon]